MRQKGETNSAKLARPDGSPMLRYNPARRAEVWAVCSNSLFRAQWRGAKDEDGKNPTVSGKPAVVAAVADPGALSRLDLAKVNEGFLLVSGGFVSAGPQMVEWYMLSPADWRGLARAVAMVDDLPSDVNQPELAPTKIA